MRNLKMGDYKEIVRKDMRLKILKDESIFELMFLPENDGKFRIGSESSLADRKEYIQFLNKASERYVRLGIHFKGILVGFILAAGKDCRLVGGILPAYQRKGLYSTARNTLIYHLNRNSIFEVMSSVSKDNVNMREFLKGVPQTKLDDLMMNHFDVEKSICPCEEFKVKPQRTERALYHISFNGNLPEVIQPKEPDGTYSANDDDYYENLPPRFSASPSVELCLRAIYPNVSHIFEENGEPKVTFSVYEVITGKVTYYPVELSEREYLHDAHITLEHVFTKPVFIKKIGEVTFTNTSDDHGLWYLPYKRGVKRYNSPRVITATIS